jgi:hypothetical protein
MMEYNGAFFALYTNVYKVLKEDFGEEKAVEIFTQIMEKGLKTAYDAMGFEKGRAEDFAKVLKARDEGVGLKVEFPEISENKVVYQFHTDPFPNLKGELPAKSLDGTYMNFKVRYLLGEDWSYKTTKHLWNGDEFTEHAIEKGEINV